MVERTKNLLIGLFVIVACSLIISIILFVKPSVGDEGKTLYVRFSNIGQIDVGTRVLYAGKPVGEVVEIERLFNARDLPSDQEGRLYMFQLILKVDSSVEVYNTDEIAVQTTGLLGEKSINIIPRPPQKGVTPVLITNEPIYADSIDPIENAFEELGKLSTKITDAIDIFVDFFQANRENLSGSIQAFKGAMEQIETTVSDINQNQLPTKVANAVDEFGNLSQLAKDSLQELKDKQAFDNLAVTIAQMRSITASWDTISSDLAEGKGTIGQLLTSDDAYLRVNAILSKIDTLMNDVNHYGLLFHLNKTWQRTRTQRMSILENLDSPQSFKNYFEQEVDQINTAMSRISMLIDRAQEKGTEEQILQNPLFKEDFAELLRKVMELSDNLRLYNEQLQEATNN